MTMLYYLLWPWGPIAAMLFGAIRFRKISEEVAGKIAVAALCASAVSEILRWVSIFIPSSFLSDSVDTMIMINSTFVLLRDVLFLLGTLALAVGISGHARSVELEN